MKRTLIIGNELNKRKDDDNHVDTLEEKPRKRCIWGTAMPVAWFLH